MGMIHVKLLQIRASEINFWNQSFTDLQLRHKRKMYPPRVKITIRMRDPSAPVVLPVRFRGCVIDGKLDVELSLPLGTP